MELTDAHQLWMHIPNTYLCRTGLQHLRLFGHNVQPRGFDLQQVGFAEVSETLPERRSSAEVSIA